jgi:hypothetical protein
LPTPAIPLDRGDHHRLPGQRGLVQGVAELAEFNGAAGEPGQLLGQAVLHPDLGHRLALAAHDA